ncbi:MAG: hypothetical protein LBR29_11990 [Methylobacteriaceae bacterium]|jgi:2-keto-3-deoxy-L-rhamnonate aldolase RhmA|nr:hypothetical protein [Methylobacteriaceae bacterium]
MSIREKIGNGEKVAGVMLRVTNGPVLGYLAREGGLDFVMFDCEHAAYGMESIRDAAITCRALGISVFARVPNLSKDYISRMLDSGVEGIMVPFIQTPEQVREFIQYAKYRPVGNRGFATVGPHTDYRKGKAADVMADANNNVMAIAQIETESAVEHIEEIAAIEGLDTLLIGPFDLSIALGVPGDMNSPVLLDAITRVSDAARRNGKLFTIHSGAALLDRFADRLSFVMQGTDFDCIVAGFQGIRNYTDKTLNTGK